MLAFREWKRKRNPGETEIREELKCWEPMGRRRSLTIDGGVRGMGCFADLPCWLGCEERFHQKSQSRAFQTEQDRDPSKGLVSRGQWCLCVGKAQGTCFKTLLV